MIDNFERNTWSSLDALGNVLKEQNTKLTDVMNEVNCIESQLCSLNINRVLLTGNPSRTSMSNEVSMTQTTMNENVTESLNMNEQNPSVDDPGNSPITINDSNQIGTSQPTANSFLENEVLDIMGQHDNETTLKAARFNKELYVSNFPNNGTTTDMVVSYLRSKNVNTGGVRIKCLVPKNKDRSKLSFISFKIDVNGELSTVLNDRNFWPIGCVVKDFVHKKRSESLNSPVIEQRNLVEPFLVKDGPIEKHLI